MTNAPQEIIGKYRIIASLASGSQGTVYRAYDPTLEREVALKVLHPRLSMPDVVERFRREARIVASINHPNIAGISEIGEHNGAHFIAIEYVPHAASELVEGGAMDVVHAASIAHQAALALEAARVSRHGVTHHDVKPDNLLLTSLDAGGTVKLIDFGIAHAEGMASMTQAGEKWGTPFYMPPEQWAGERGDTRSDVYSLGVVLYQMLAGRVPFDSDAENALAKQKEIADRHLEAAPVPLRSVRGDVTEEMDALVAKCMAKSPDARFQTPGEMAGALADMFGFSAPSASGAPSRPPVRTSPEPPPRARAPRPSSPARRSPPIFDMQRAKPRNRMALFAAAALGALIVIFAVVVMASRLGDDSAELPPRILAVAPPEATSTPAPTPTAQPTATPATQPTNTPAPTATAQPTATPAPQPTNTPAPAPSAQTQTATDDPAAIFQSALTAMNALSSYRAEVDSIDTRGGAWGFRIRSTEVQAEVQAPDKMSGDMTTTETETLIPNGGTTDLGEPYHANHLIAAALSDQAIYEADWMNKRINVIGTAEDVSRGRVYLSTALRENVVTLNGLSDAALDEIEVGESVEFACVIGEYAREAVSMTQCGPAEREAGETGESDPASTITDKFVLVGDYVYTTRPDPNNPQNQFWVQEDPAAGDFEFLRSFLMWFETGSEFEFTPNELVGTKDLNGEETYRLRGSFGFKNTGETAMDVDVWVGTSASLILKVSMIFNEEDVVETGSMGLEEVTISYSRFNDAAIQIEPPADFRKP